MDEVPHVAVDVTLQRRALCAGVFDGLIVNGHA